MRNVKGRDLIMLIAGGYLIYLGIQIIRTGIMTGEIGDKWRWLALVCAIAFIVFGAGQLILRIRNLFTNAANEQTEEALENAGKEQAPAAEETAVAELTEEEPRQRSIQEMIADNRVEDDPEGKE